MEREIPVYGRKAMLLLNLSCLLFRFTICLCSKLRRWSVRVLSVYRGDSCGDGARRIGMSPG